MIESGGRVVQETRLYNPDTGETVSMRSKEARARLSLFSRARSGAAAHQRAWLSEVRAQMPELPAARRERVHRAITGLREYDAEVLTATRAMSEYFEEVAKVSGDATRRRELGDGRSVAAAQRGRQGDRRIAGVSARQLGELVALIGKGEITGKLAKEIFPKMFAAGEAPEVIMRARRAGADQRCRRARQDHRRSDRRESETGGAVQGGQDDGARIPGRTGDEGQPRTGEPGCRQRSLEKEAGLARSGLGDGRAFFVMVANVDPLDQEHNVFGDICCVVGDAF